MSVQLIALRKGGAKCSSACPYYEEKGQVRGVNDVPLKTHCRATMQDVIVDCNVWNPHNIEKLQVTEEQWKAMQAAVHKRAKKERKPWPEDHEEIHPVGYNWKNVVNRAPAAEKHDRWNAEKSSKVKSLNIKH